MFSFFFILSVGYIIPQWDPAPLFGELSTAPVPISFLDCTDTDEYAGN